MLGSMEGPDVLMRVHSECLTGDAFSSPFDCGPNLMLPCRPLLRTVGVVYCIFVKRDEASDCTKIEAYHLQDQGADTLDANLILGHPADGRDYKIAATMLNDLEIKEVALLTNNPDKVKQLEEHGIVVSETVPLVAGVGQDNLQYLQTKVERMGHTIDSEELE